VLEQERAWRPPVLQARVGDSRPAQRSGPVTPIILSMVPWKIRPSKESVDSKEEQDT
jgi:hypothetical protein